MEAHDEVGRSHRPPRQASRLAHSHDGGGAGQHGEGGRTACGFATLRVEVNFRSEYVVGVRLLDRTSRGVETTAYGRALLRRGMGAFDELRQGIKDIESLTDPTVGEVRVGCPEAISAGLLSAIIDRFSRQYPRAIVSVTPADNMSQESRQLRDRRVDFLLGRIPKPFTDAVL